MPGLTPGLIARHAPGGQGGKEAAIIDIAQDLLLAHVAGEGMFDDLLVFKGGTALRKMFAGSAGRFSTDLDFALAPIDADRGTVTELLVDTIDGFSTDDFSYTVEEHRGKWHVRYESRFGDVGALSTKLDVGPPVWLPPQQRPWVKAGVHDSYELPDALPVMALEENLSEKIARLNRVQLARDLYDLWWIGTNPPHSAFDEELVAKLAALKCWVDTYGLRSSQCTWLAVDNATALDPPAWLEPDQRVTDESIGLLMNPPPDLKQLRKDVSARYRFLGNIPTELANITQQDRRALGDITAQLRLLPGSRFTEDLVIY